MRQGFFFNIKTQNNHTKDFGVDANGLLCSCYLIVSSIELFFNDFLT